MRGLALLAISLRSALVALNAEDLEESWTETKAEALANRDAKRRVNLIIVCVCVLS